MCIRAPSTPVLLNQIRSTICMDSSAEVKQFVNSAEKRNLRVASGRMERQHTEGTPFLMGQKFTNFKQSLVSLCTVKAAQMCYLCMMLNNIERNVFVFQFGLTKSAGLQTVPQQNGQTVAKWPPLGPPIINKTPTVSNVSS